MKIEDTFCMAETALVYAHDRFLAADYDTALAMLAASYAHVRVLLQETFIEKCRKEIKLDEKTKAPG